MEIIKAANLALRFLLELCALAALGYWGFQTGHSLIVKIGLAIGAPLLAAVIWGTFISPKAAVPVPTGVWLALQVAILDALLLDWSRPAIAPSPGSSCWPWSSTAS